MHNHNNHERKGMMWMIIPCLLLLGILGVHLLGANIFSGLKLASLGHLLPILMGVCIVGHVLMIHSAQKSVGHAMSNKTPQGDNENEIISRNGLHWHPEISIYVKGEKQEIPHTGLTDMDMIAMHNMHMHHKHDGPNEQGVIHLKFQGLVRKSDITLGQIFKKWGKSILSFGTNLKMTVNGNDNTEYENYVMQDRDKIELRYE